MRLRDEGCQDLYQCGPGLEVLSLWWPGAEWERALVCSCLGLGSVAQLGFLHLKVSLPWRKEVFPFIKTLPPHLVFLWTDWGEGSRKRQL